MERSLFGECFGSGRKIAGAVLESEWKCFSSFDFACLASISRKMKEKLPCVLLMILLILHEIFPIFKSRITPFISIIILIVVHKLFSWYQLIIIIKKEIVLHLREFLDKSYNPSTLYHQNMRIP